MFVPEPFFPQPTSIAAPRLRIKVCGMRTPANIWQVAALGIDFMGFIFYDKSPRYMAQQLKPSALRALPGSVLKIGVFVNETTTRIREQVAHFGLDLVQLHGHEPPAQCAELRATGLPVIKAFSVDEDFSLAQLTPYAACCNYFLFDTKGPALGGNGIPFDWQLLTAYALPVPYFLAGGLDLAHAEQLRTLHLPGLFGIDLNSRFELVPGEKDVVKLRQLLQQLRSGAEPATALDFSI